LEEPSGTPKQTRLRLYVKRLLQVIAVCVVVFGWVVYRGYSQTILNADLIDAVGGGSASDVKTLLEQGADPNARVQPVGHNFDLMEWLMAPLPGGNEVKEGATALITAAGNVQGYESLKLLVEHGANIHAKGPFEDNALVTAARAGNVDSVKYLMGKGLSINSDFADGRMVLSAAVESKNPEMVRYLISAGINVNGSAGSGRPLYLAKELHLTEIANILTKAGAK
jgi:ankyrin repeat protein